MEDIEKPINFIYQAINDDIDEGRFSKNIVTRFPPEPNGYLHIGHAKSICLNFGIVEQYENAKCHLRLDDTNPSKESNEFVEAIKENVSWLGFDWGNNLFYASDYFDQFYEYAVTLIELGKAYVCDLNFEDMRKLRGTLTTPGENSPYRNRTVKENLELFSDMKNGLIPEGDKVLRAKIDMASPNLNMRDPTLYRVRHVSHYRTGSKWCIYPMYDFAHCVSDSIEHITHSICTLEFEDHRPLYDCILDSLDLFHPRQIEFPRLNITHTVLSKRKLLSFVEDSKVNGWNDPRMPTLSGMKRRGYTPSAIREFCSKVGLSKRDSVIEIQLLEHCLREDLNASAKRVLGVINPLKLVIDNYPEDKVEFFDAANNPENLEDGTRKLPFSKYLFIENSDFQEHPENKFYRFAPGNEVRLRYAYIAKCTSYTVDPVTNVVSEIHCDIDFESRGGMPSDGRRIRGTVHWVSASHAVKGIVKHFDYLLKNSESDEIESETIFTECLLEESLANSVAGQVFQFERLGYYCRDIYDSHDGTIIFNQTVSLRDSWGKRNQN
jgi:glutaminyl-tRNA synthetase